MGVNFHFLQIPRHWKDTLPNVVASAKLKNTASQVCELSTVFTILYIDYIDILVSSPPIFVIVGNLKALPYNRHYPTPNCPHGQGGGEPEA